MPMELTEVPVPQDYFLFNRAIKASANSCFSPPQDLHEDSFKIQFPAADCLNGGLPGAEDIQHLPEEGVVFYLRDICQNR